MSRAVSRELLAACVLRPLMMFSTPYYVNKGMYKLLEERAQRERSIVAVPAAEAAKQRQLRGTYEFERRIV